MDSILTSIKKLLGIAEEYEHFDPDIVMYINSAFSVLTQLGVGPEEGFRIEDASKTWSEFLYDDPRLEFAKTFIYLKVRLAFDTPQSYFANPYPVDFICDRVVAVVFAFHVSASVPVNSFNLAALSTHV